MSKQSFFSTGRWPLNSGVSQAAALALLTLTFGIFPENLKTPKSAADSDFQQPVNQSADTLSSVRASEQKLLYAKKIVAAYQALLQSPDISETDKRAANRRISELTKEAARDSLMIGKKFYLLDEIDKFQKETNQEIDKFLAAAPDKDKLEIIKFLKAASRKDPISCRANFILAMGYAVASREYDLAVEQFQECEERLSNFGAFASPNTDLSLQAVYNNLAILQIRRGFLDSALKYWISAFDISKSLPDPIRENFLHQSEFIRAAVASKGHDYFSAPETTTLTKYTKFADQAGLNQSMAAASRQHGWHYLNLQMRPEDPDVDLLKISLVDAACLNCNGAGKKPCGACRGDGIVMGKVYDQRVLPTGDIKVIETSVKKKCEKCEKGFLPCLDVDGNQLCTDGVER